MIKTIIFLFLLLLFYTGSAQQVDSLLNKQVELKRIEGIFDSRNKSFYAKNIEVGNPYWEHQYFAKGFRNGLGIIKYSFKSSKNEDFRDFERVGIIDTLGNIIVPCVYEELDFIVTRIEIPTEKGPIDKFIWNLDYFTFEDSDCIGVLERGNKIVFKIPKVGQTSGNNVRNRISDINDQVKQDIDYGLIFQDSLFGLFSFSQKKLVIPPKYNNILNIYNDYAIVSFKGEWSVINCVNGIKSEGFQMVHYLKNGTFLVMKNNKWSICRDPLNAEKSSIDSLNKDGVLEYFNHHFIVRFNDKLGVMNEMGQTIIPFIYDDIFFYDENYFLVKKNITWAISSYQHNLLSDFDFLDVEKQNKKNFENLMLYMKFDTNEIKKIYLQREELEKIEWVWPVGSRLKLQMQLSIFELMNQLNSRILSKYTHYVLKKQDGYHINPFDVKSFAWDNVFIIPKAKYILYFNEKVGVQKGDKYGYIIDGHEPKEYLKYDNIQFYPVLFEKDVYGFESNPFCVIKKGKLYFEVRTWDPFSDEEDYTRWEKVSKFYSDF